MLLHFKKPVLLLLIFLFSNSTYASYSCASINDIAGNYSGGYSGAHLNFPMSSFAYIAINNSGQIALGQYFNFFGLHVGTFNFWTGTISIINTAQCLALSNLNGIVVVIKFSSGGNLAVMSTPFDPVFFISGSFWKD